MRVCELLSYLFSPASCKSQTHPKDSWVILKTATVLHAALAAIAMEFLIRLAVDLNCRNSEKGALKSYDFEGLV